jgi:GMP synthase-like glutamine amidotransferase
VPPRLLVLQHIACEPPAAYEDELRAWGADLDRIEVDEGEALPDWRPYAGIIAMGGPMGAYEDERLPWLDTEKRLIGDAVRAGLPFWGVCLGVQLLAASLGARAFPGHRAEVGVLEVELTPEADADPVFSQLPSRFHALQWHSDTFDLPAGAVQLARSAAYEQQAFRFQKAYGLQFHLEVDLALATQWAAVPAYAHSLRELLGDDGLPTLLTALARHESASIAHARRLFAGWLEHIVGLQPPVAAAPGARRSPSGTTSRPA